VRECLQPPVFSLSKPPAYSLQPAAYSLLSPRIRRCLRCGCIKRDTCRLRHYGARYGARPTDSAAPGATRPDASHAEIVYEPGKCILCGLCLKIAQAAGEAPGLSFVGRGTHPRRRSFGDSMATALKEVRPRLRRGLSDGRAILTRRFLDMPDPHCWC